MDQDRERWQHREEQMEKDKKGRKISGKKLFKECEDRIKNKVA